MIISHVDELALAIVSSSSPDLSIDDKIKLYIESRTAILDHNQSLIDEGNTEPKGGLKVFREGL